MKQSEVLIIGGGPAGAACAWKLRQYGVNVLILDKQAFPRNKTCAGWITPQVLRDLEFEPEEYPHGLSTFSTLHLSIRGMPLIIPGKQYAIRRYEFDGWLLQRSNAPLIQHHVREISEVEGGYVVDNEYFGRHLVGAGGTYCPVYHTLFKAESRRDPGGRIVGMEEEFQWQWKNGQCRLWFMENNLPGYAWYVPKKDGWVNIGVGGFVGKMKARGDTIQNHWLELVTKMETRGLITRHTYKPVSHLYNVHQNVPEVQRNRVYLVGDAAGLATLDMGEGIGPAVSSGLLAAQAILSDQKYTVETIPRYSLLPRIFQRREQTNKPNLYQL